MPRWILVPVVVIGGLAAAGTVAVMAGRSAWQRETERMVAQLRAGRGEQPARAASTTAELTPPAKSPATGTPALSPAKAQPDLPAPVARYFALVLPEGEPPIGAPRIRWRGEFQSRPGGGWAPFTAEQHFTADPPGFVWDAEIQMIPLVPVRIRDSYHDGAGAMHGRIGGVLPIVTEGGTPEIAQSALARWLGEAVWFPTALLPDTAGDDAGGAAGHDAWADTGGAPRAAVRWEAIDDTTARATVTDGAVSASAEFHFAPTGEITRMTALRYRDVDGAMVLTPFEGEYHDYARHAGILVPTRAEVAWLTPEGRYPYWRAGPTEIRY
jgi:hypothetical protein